ncbi:hypothetical protein ANTQUA_LOCUS4997 [Anthophora quadrimaculata]
MVTVHFIHDSNLIYIILRLFPFLKQCNITCPVPTPLSCFVCVCARAASPNGMFFTRLRGKSDCKSVSFAELVVLYLSSSLSLSLSLSLSIYRGNSATGGKPTHMHCYAFGDEHNVHSKWIDQYLRAFGKQSNKQNLYAMFELNVS